MTDDEQVVTSQHEGDERRQIGLLGGAAHGDVERAAEENPVAVEEARPRRAVRAGLAADAVAVGMDDREVPVAREGLEGRGARAAEEPRQIGGLTGLGTARGLVAVRDVQGDAGAFGRPLNRALGDASLAACAHELIEKAK